VSRGTVATYTVPGCGFAHGHERATRDGIAKRLAALKGLDFAGEYEPTRRYPSPVYLVPSDTLVGVDAAAALGVRTEHDLFGGVAPHAFVPTKAITHPLIRPDAHAPLGWSHAFGRQVREVVLDGFTVFTVEDAREAGRRLLERGPVRVKPVRATGGRGQKTATSTAGLNSVFDGMNAAELGRHGLVLEEDLGNVTTYSVGQVRFAEFLATYCGTQSLTTDNGGATVYGGSKLLVARGGFEALLGLGLPPDVALAATQAQTYDAAATGCFPDLFASRRNYDVACGLAADGRWRCGVLEQSWRIGGASGAEIAALEALRAAPALRAVCAVTVERYGEGQAPPPNATIYFHGVDERDGPMSKYALVEPHDDPR
jgi:hypothetical protein